MIVTTFETVVVAESFFKYHFNFAYLIVDEAHRIVRIEQIHNKQSMAASTKPAPGGVLETPCSSCPRTAFLCLCVISF